MIKEMCELVISSVNIDQDLFIEGSTLLAELVMKFHGEEIQDMFFEKVLNNFKILFISKSFDRKTFQKLELFLCSILKRMRNSSNILNIENFLIFIDNFQRDVKMNICLTILKQVLLEDTRSIDDTYLSYVLLKLVKYVHDCIIFNKKLVMDNKQSNNSNNEIDKISSFESISIFKELENVVIVLLEKVDYGLDYESYFNFLCEVRNSIFEMQNVIDKIIKKVFNICINTYKIVKGKNSKKTLRFIKVCISFCQITIPSITCKFKKISLLIEAAELSLCNNLISETDSIVKSTISIINECLIEDTIFNSKTILNNSNSNTSLDLKIKKNIEHLNNMIKKLLSLLVVIPDNPENAFQIIKGIINCMNSLEKLTISSQIMVIYKDIFLINIYSEIVKYLSTQLQIKLPYHVQNVDSNDEIFCGEDNYVEEGTNLLNIAISELLATVESLKLKSGDIRKYNMKSNIGNTLNEAISVFESFLKNTKNSKIIIEQMRIIKNDIDK